MPASYYHHNFIDPSGNYLLAHMADDGSATPREKHFRLAHPPRFTSSEDNCSYTAACFQDRIILLNGSNEDSLKVQISENIIRDATGIRELIWRNLIDQRHDAGPGRDTFQPDLRVHKGRSNKLNGHWLANGMACQAMHRLGAVNLRFVEGFVQDIQPHYRHYDSSRFGHRGLVRKRRFHR